MIQKLWNKRSGCIYIHEYTRAQVTTFKPPNKASSKTYPNQVMRGRVNQVIACFELSFIGIIIVILLWYEYKKCKM